MDVAGNDEVNKRSKGDKMGMSKKDVGVSKLRCTLLPSPQIGMFGVFSFPRSLICESEATLHFRYNVSFATRSVRIPSHVDIERLKTDVNHVVDDCRPAETEQNLQGPKEAL